MTRFSTIARPDQPTDLDAFRRTFSDMWSWRFDRRSWITRASLSASGGTIYLECESPSAEPFVTWLDAKGWRHDEIQRVDAVLEAGTVWTMGEGGH